MSRLEPGTPKEAVDLIEKLLVYEPLKRITAEEALKHEFFSDQSEKPNSNATSASSSRKRLRSEMSNTDDASAQREENKTKKRLRKM